MARKLEKLRRLDTRVTIRELKMVDDWATANQTTRSTIVRDMIERERRRLEMLERAEQDALEAAATERATVAKIAAQRTTRAA